jgi:hypothetical protein
MPSFLGLNGKGKREKQREEERKKFESGVSEIFRNVLGEAGFASFKKCTYLSLPLFAMKSIG